jgi:hypothetical protein
VLTGGADFDTFFLDTRIGKSQQDVLTDFNRFEDTIALSRTYFRKLGGSVGTSELRFGTEAKDKNDYLIYNKKMVTCTTIRTETATKVKSSSRNSLTKQQSERRISISYSNLYS